MSRQMLCMAMYGVSAPHARRIPTSLHTRLPRLLNGLFDCAGVYSSYIYTEDDQEITWLAIQSWAADTTILE